MTASRLALFGGCTTLATVLAAAPAQALPAAESPPAGVHGSAAGTTAVAPADAPEAKKSKPKASPRLFADTTTGPSTWRGKRLRHPNGSRFPAAVIRWANLVSAIMAEKNIPRRYLRGILAQIQQESSGNPWAVNLWDSNAARGTPSKGLLQVIAPTYRYYAKPGYRHLRYQTVPYTNLWAAMDYVRDRYGMKKFKHWNRGYNQGY